MPESDATPSAPVAAEHERAAAKAASAGARRHYEAGLADLIARGALAPGALLRKTYRGTDYEVVVRSGGRLEADGQVYDSPSQAARLMTGQKAVNGWAFWTTDSGTPVGDLRDDAN